MAVHRFHSEPSQRAGASCRNSFREHSDPTDFADHGVVRERVHAPLEVWGDLSRAPVDDAALEQA